VLDLDAGYAPRGEPRRLTAQRLWNSGLAWTRDGREIVYSASDAGSTRLFRVPADGRRPPARIELAGATAYWPAVAGARLVFSSDVNDHDIYRLGPGGEASALLDSASVDMAPQYSPDGRQIAFCSARSGTAMELWIAGADGSSPRQLTRGPGRAQGSPRWSHDGTAIAFDSFGDDGRYDVWTIRSDGTRLLRLTSDRGDENLPSWSHDDRFVYFTSARSGRHEVWRVPAEGGAAAQVTRHGGFIGLEASDGSILYYTRSFGDSPLFASPPTGGAERQLAACVSHLGVALVEGGIAYLACPPPATDAPVPVRTNLRLWSAASGRERVVATIDSGVGGSQGLSLSPDARHVLFTRQTRTSDILLIDNFR
jgi:Tol biopolymer transport system component